MIIELVKQWEENKYRLEEYFKTTEQNEFPTYSHIVKKLFELCIPNLDIDKMTVINDGDCQGTLIFIIPSKTYQPGVSDYVMTAAYYGGGSPYDTLQSIREYGDGLPTDKQVNEYMTLALHLVQKLKMLGDPIKTF